MTNPLPITTNKRLLTPREVAEQFSVSAAWVRDHATRRQPRIPVIKLGGKRKPLLRFRQQDIDEFIKAHLVQPSERYLNDERNL